MRVKITVLTKTRTNLQRISIHKSINAISMENEVSIRKTFVWENKLKKSLECTYIKNDNNSICFQHFSNCFIGVGCF